MEIVKSFNMQGVIKAASKSPEGEMLISGPIADEDQVDLQNDIITKAAIQSGLEFFKAAGRHVDYGHLFRKTHKPEYLIGKAIDFNDGPDGKIWMTAKLYPNNEYATGLYNLVKNGGHAGFSIDGICKARDAEDNRKIIETQIMLIAADPMPIGYNNYLVTGKIPGTNSIGSVMKSLMGNDEYMIKSDQLEDIDPDDQKGEVSGMVKLTKSEAEYRKGVGGKMCRYCRYYLNKTCQKVAGAINPDYCCDYFKTRLSQGTKKEGSEDDTAPEPEDDEMNKSVTITFKMDDDDDDIDNEDENDDMNEEEDEEENDDLNNIDDEPSSPMTDDLNDVDPNNYPGMGLGPGRGLGLGPCRELGPINGTGKVKTIIISKRPVKKAMTTGSGVVQPGQTGGAALRKQELYGAEDEKSRKSETRGNRRKSSRYVDNNNREFEDIDLKQRRSESKTRRSRDIRKADDFYDDFMYDDEECVKAYVGFKKLEEKLRRRGVKNPAALAAYIGRKKYGKKRFDRAARRGKSLRGKEGK